MIICVHFRAPHHEKDIEAPEKVQRGGTKFVPGIKYKGTRKGFRLLISFTQA